MSARTIALQLRTLAADPDSQGLLLQEASCLSGLVTLLHADNEEDVLILSLQALAFLASNPANHAGLVHAPGLLVALTTLTEKSAVVLKTLAQNVMAALECYINGGVVSSTPGNATPTLGARGRTPTLGASGRGSRDNSRPATRAGKEDPVTGSKAQQDTADKENQDNQMAAVPINPAPSKPSYLKKSAPAAAPIASSATSSSSSSSGSSRPGYLTSNASAHAGTGGSRALAVHATASSASDSASNLAARYQAQQAAKKKAEAAAAAAAPAKKGGMLSGIASYFW